MAQGPFCFTANSSNSSEQANRMPTAIVSLGSNLGDRTATLDSAAAALDATPGVRVVRRSSWYETSPIGGPGFQEPFLNGAAVLETSLDPESLLSEMQRIENEHGRIREEHWGPRTLDLDLLTYDDVVMHTPRLTLPHPRLSYRKFVLDGLLQIAPHDRHPLIGRSYVDLLKHLETMPNYVAFVGPSESQGVDFRSQFAAEAADCGGARLVDATPRDIPAFAELAASRRVDMDTATNFFKARAAAIRASLNDAAGDWVVDDGWLPAELMALAKRMSFDELKSRGKEFWSAFASLNNEVRADDVVLPKLLAVLRGKNESPQAAVESIKLLQLGNDLPPLVILDYSDRERALAEFAAALDAAR
jgi:2-amino-4-hydroxy-6-hydroxymethyldihydropteridine diphosphokinase